jgi:hypothetical protein
MLSPLDSGPKTALRSIKKRLEKYLAPGSGIDVDEKSKNNQTTILYDLLYCIDLNPIYRREQNEENIKRQQAVIDVTNALLNRGARPDTLDKFGQTPLLYMVSYCMGIYSYNKKEGKNISRANEIALLQKMLQAHNLANKDAKFLASQKSAYEAAQDASDQEVLGLLIAAGITK